MNTPYYTSAHMELLSSERLHRNGCSGPLTFNSILMNIKIWKLFKSMPFRHYRFEYCFSCLWTGDFHNLVILQKQLSHRWNRWNITYWCSNLEYVNTYHIYVCMGILHIYSHTYFYGNFNKIQNFLLMLIVKMKKSSFFLLTLNMIGDVKTQKMRSYPIAET